MRKGIRRFLLWFVVALLAAIVFLFLPFNPPKWTASEIADRVDLLNEKAAVVTPHKTLGKKTREANLALFEKVEKGEQLTVEESAAYRVLFQKILKDNQGKLSKLDSQLTVLTDYKPDEKNNVGTLGIEGAHDHHDASSSANIVELRRDLERLDHADGAMASLHRVRAAIAAWKDLDDVILHMAPGAQTKSVPRTPEVPVDELQKIYEEMMVHFKLAQFEPVNSPAYANEVHQALDRYSAMVVLVQDRIYAQLNPAEQSLAGRWGSWRSLAPSLRGVTDDRIPRNKP